MLIGIFCICAVVSYYHRYPLEVLQTECVKEVRYDTRTQATLFAHAMYSHMVVSLTLNFQTDLS